MLREEGLKNEEYTAEKWQRGEVDPEIASLFYQETHKNILKHRSQNKKSRFGKKKYSRFYARWKQV